MSRGTIFDNELYIKIYDDGDKIFMTLIKKLISLTWSKKITISALMIYSIKKTFYKKLF